jgi:hypothetical protein
MQELVSKIERLLEKREEVYPVQDHSYQALSEAIARLTEALLDRAKEQKDFWQPDSQLVEKTREFIENPVFICGAMKTGTTLLTRLLDNHPSLMVMPGDSHYYTNFRDYSGSNGDLYKYWMQRLINPTGQKPFWFLGSDLDSYLNFLLYLEYFLTTEYDTFQSVVAAVFCANPNRCMSVRHWVEKKPENERYVRWFIERFPKARFLHIVRDPLPNIASLKKLGEFKNIPFRAVSYAVRLKSLMALGADHFNTNGEKVYRFIRYEDLLTDTEKEMATYLEIAMHKNLLTSSENGVPARANSMYPANRITGSVTTGGIDEKWRDVLTQKEQEEIVTVLFSQAIDLGYTHWSGDGVINLRKTAGFKKLMISLKEKLITLKYRADMRPLK